MPHSKQISPTPVRIPEELKAWLKARADANFRSLSGEIIAILAEERRKDEEAGKEYQKPRDGRSKQESDD